MSYTANFVRIKDTNTSPLWEGEEVYMIATNFRMESSNLISGKPKTFQLQPITTDDIGDDETTGIYLANYNRRKSNISYAGFNNPIIRITCAYNPNEMSPISSINGTDTMIFTPNKLMELILKPRTVYIKDEFLIELLSNTEATTGTSIIPKVYGTNGMPVVLDSWSLDPSTDGKEVIMDLTFREDKEVE